MALGGRGAGPGPGMPGVPARPPGWRRRGCRRPPQTGRTARSRRSATRRPHQASPVRSRHEGLLRPAPRTGASCFADRGTHRQRMRTVRPFFERIIEWDWPGTPARNPVIAWDIPKKPEPLPKFLDDRDAAKLMAAARASTDPRDRLVVELLARTGMRAAELADLDADAVVLIGAGHWLRIPLGKLRNDRYVPLHPELVSLLAAWTAANLDHIRRHRPDRRPPRPAGPPLDRTDRAPRRPRRRGSRRPPAPAAAHPRHPGDQPRHAAGSHRRPASGWRPPRTARPSPSAAPT